MNRPPFQLALSHESPRPRLLELVALAIWTIGSLTLLVIGEDLLPLSLGNLPRLLVDHHRTRLVDDGHMREFLGVESLGNLLAVVGGDIDMAQPVGLQQL